MRKDLPLTPTQTKASFDFFRNEDGEKINRGKTYAEYQQQAKMLNNSVIQLNRHLTMPKNHI